MIDVRQPLQLPSGGSKTFSSMGRLVESVLRKLDGRRVRDQDVEELARQLGAPRAAEERT
jgi:hypothetical protein